MPGVVFLKAMHSTDAGQHCSRGGSGVGAAQYRYRPLYREKSDKKSDWTILTYSLWATSAWSWTDSWWVYLCRLHPTDRRTYLFCWWQGA